MNDENLGGAAIGGLVVLILVMLFGACGSTWSAGERDIAREECRVCAGPCPSWPVTDSRTR